MNYPQPIVNFLKEQTKLLLTQPIVCRDQIFTELFHGKSVCLVAQHARIHIEIENTNSY